MILKNKVVIIVGAGGLLGREIVRSVLEEGGLVVAADVNLDSVAKITSNLDSESVISAEVDITSRESIQRLLKIAEDKWGGIDGAVNSAYPRNKHYGRELFEVTYDDFCENVSLHLGGYFLFMQQCAKYSKQQNKQFSLVNMSSVYGVVAPRFDVYQGTGMTNAVEYAAIKSALQHLVSYFSSAMRGTSFRVNAVSPGGIRDSQPQSFIKRYAEYCNQKGMLDVDDVVGSIVFLLSDKSKYIVAQNLVVDDGFSI
jgi:NAD(P)-dependent dehydrogenase (short-subunit alcohol dehydrogenase family)